MLLKRGGLVMVQKKERVTVTLSPELNEELREQAEKRGLSMSTIVTLALEQYFKLEKKA